MGQGFTARALGIPHNLAVRLAGGGQRRAPHAEPSPGEGKQRRLDGHVEIRAHTRVEHRLFYVAKFDEAVYVLHAFAKRTRHTPTLDIELARTRLADLRRRRAQKREAQ